MRPWPSARARLSGRRVERHGRLFFADRSAVVSDRHGVIWAGDAGGVMDYRRAATSGGPAILAADRRQARRCAGRTTCRPRSRAVVDCRWADPTSGAFEHDSVPLGRGIPCPPGFMEITYDSGAKVILQGPVTYEVESARGGFLSLGKLTARVESKGLGAGDRDQGRRASEPPTQPSPKRGAQPTASLALRPSAGKAESRNPKAEISNPQSPIPNPLFAVRTPTAVVTDLGTEFGVEVDRRGLRSRTSSGARSRCGWPMPAKMFLPFNWEPTNRPAWNGRRPGCSRDSCGGPIEYAHLCASTVRASADKSIQYRRGVEAGGCGSALANRCGQQRPRLQAATRCRHGDPLRGNASQRPRPVTMDFDRRQYAPISPTASRTRSALLSTLWTCCRTRPFYTSEPGSLQPTTWTPSA